MIYLFAEMVAKAGCDEPLKSALLDLVRGSRSEGGCVRYDLHQDSRDLNRFMIYEIWESKSALDAHKTAPHMEDFRHFRAENDVIESIAVRPCEPVEP
ncbi:antibiotic biosynthesis monooxygenase [Parasalinivibrio latis]|uniref:putative quinol monooxygenase n=1 Tax=Parasalinivibrio latis TaxID=2952610 RepID=UPI0030E5EEAE